MALTPMVFIGLGGTGGKVLGVIQNSIRARLEAEGVLELPESWQVLHMDVAAVSDTGGNDFGLRATDFYGLTKPGDKYNLEWERLRDSVPDGAIRRHAIDSWAPRKHEVTADITLGASQFRAVGRVVALSNLTEMNKKLRDRINRARTASTGGELTALATRLGIAESGPANHTPLVIVVSSVGGGSGAGITAEVLDLLKAQGILDPMVNLFTPEVFTHGETDTIAANGLYAINELVALDWDPGDQGYENSRHDVFPALSAPVTGGPGGAFGYFLVGTSSQGGTVFSRAEDVYLVMGRMYAELAFDQDLTQAVRAHVQTNFPSAKHKTKINLEPRLGNGTDNPNLAGLGFARLSVGRDFFYPYAHQRLTNLVTTQLLEAHLNDPAASDMLSNEELLARSVELNYARFVADVQLRELDTQAAESDDILRLISVRLTEPYKQRLESFMSGVIRDVEAQARTRFMITRISSADAAQAAYLRCKTATQDAEAADGMLTDLRRQARGQLLKSLGEYERTIQNRLAAAVPHTCAEVGLPVVRAMLERLEQELLQASKQLREQSEAHLASANGWLLSLQTPPTTAPRAFDPSDRELLERIGSDAAGAVDRFVDADERASAARLTQDIAFNVVARWREAIDAATDALLRGANREVGSSTLRATWPTETGGVPDALKPSRVEFSLDKIDDFPRDFREQILIRMPQNDDDRLESVAVQQDRALGDAVRDIITGMKDRLDDGAQTRVRWSVQEVSVCSRNWVSTLHPNVSAQPLGVRVRLGLHDLQGRITEWLTAPDESTHAYLNCTLRDYLDPDQSRVGDVELRHRHDRMEGQFSAFLKAARPLLRLNLELTTKVHEKTTHETLCLIGTLDVPELSAEKLQRLGMTSLRTRLAAVAQQNDIESISFSGGPSPSATMLSVSAFPVHPVVVSSLMEPVMLQPLALEARGSRHRRARPLPETIPMSPAAQRLLLAGLYAGRMLGVIEFDQYEPDRVRVRCAAGWQELALPGVRDRDQHRPNLDLPGRLLESYLPALVAAYRVSSRKPLEPYAVLAELGRACTTFSSPLARWVQDGSSLPASSDPFLLPQEVTAEERLAAVQACFVDFEASLRRLEEESQNLTDCRTLPTVEALGLARAALAELAGNLRSPQQRGNRV